MDALGRVLDRCHGDLRTLRERAGGDTGTLRELMQDIPRTGPGGAHVFCSEVRAVWPELRPFFDARSCRAAARAVCRFPFSAYAKG